MKRPCPRLGRKKRTSARQKQAMGRRPVHAVCRVDRRHRQRLDESHSICPYKGPSPRMSCTAAQPAQPLRSPHALRHRPRRHVEGRVREEDAALRGVDLQLVVEGVVPDVVHVLPAIDDPVGHRVRDVQLVPELGALRPHDEVLHRLAPQVLVPAKTDRAGSGGGGGSEPGGPGAGAGAGREGAREREREQSRETVQPEPPVRGAPGWRRPRPGGRG